MDANRELAAFVAGNPLRRSAIVAFVSDFAASLPPGARVLDVGAGSQPYRPLFHHQDYVAHDWPNSVHLAQPDIVGDLASGLTVAARSFDAVLCTEVLEHVLDTGAAVAELRRLLVPGGNLAITVPFVVTLHEEPWDFWRPTSHALHSVLSAAGFTNIVITPLSGWFGTVAEMVLDFGLCTAPARPSLLRRLMSKAVRLVGKALAKAAPHLDRLDARKALPVGWGVTAIVPAVKLHDATETQ